MFMTLIGGPETVSKLNRGEGNVGRRQNLFHVVHGDQLRCAVDLGVVFLTSPVIGTTN